MTRAERLLLFAMGHCMLLLVRVVLPFGTGLGGALFWTIIRGVRLCPTCVDERKLRLRAAARAYREAVEGA